MRFPSLLLCFGLPVAILVLGFSLAGFFGFRTIPQLMDEIGRGNVQAGFELSIPKPGRYTVWSVLAEDASARAIKAERLGLPPGARVYLYSKETGREIPLTKLLQQKKAYGGEVSVSLGTFDTNVVDQVVEFKATGLRRKTLVSVTPENTAEAVRVFVMLLGIVLVSIAFAIFVFIVLIHRRQRLVAEANQP